jgi:hypothetical protein
VQPTQLSLLSNQVPAPPATAGRRLPEPQLAAAVTLLARLIAEAADPSSATGEGEVSVDE